MAPGKTVRCPYFENAEVGQPVGRCGRGSGGAHGECKAAASLAGRYAAAGHEVRPVRRFVPLDRSIGGRRGPGRSGGARQGPDPQVELRQRELARQEVLAEMRTAGVGMLFQNETGSVAVIGTRVVHIGDLIEGFRVVAIGRDGVVLEPANLNELPDPETPSTR